MRKLFVIFVFIFILFIKVGSPQIGKWKITGMVKSESGSGLSPASVFICNSTKGATSDTSGAFSINGLSNGNYNVIVSFVGYETQIYPISINERNDSVLFVMKENAKELEDVIINLKNGDRSQQLKNFSQSLYWNR